jgi:phospholipid-transporting ATPase
LRNTEWIYAVSIYTGHESKIMKNSSKSRSKKSKLEITTNKYILRGILFQTFLCILASTFSTIFSTQKISYLNSDDPSKS